MPNKEKSRAPGNSKSGNQSGHIVEPTTNNAENNQGSDKKGKKPASPDQDMSKMTPKKRGK